MRDPDLARSAKLRRCKRIATTIQHWPALPCGCLVRDLYRPCGCKDVCGCEVQLDLCDCDELPHDKELAKVISIGAFLEAADPEHYAEPTDPPIGHLVADRYLRLMVMQRRLACGQKPYCPKDLDPQKTKGGTSAGVTGNGRTAWRGAAGYDWFSDEPWWDDHLEVVMSRHVSTREATEYPLFYLGYQAADIYDLPGDLQAREIHHAETCERAGIAHRRLELGQIIAKAQRMIPEADRRLAETLKRVVDLAVKDLENLRHPEWMRGAKPKAADRPSRPKGTRTRKSVAK